jgi:hypothetical protein
VTLDCWDHEDLLGVAEEGRLPQMSDYIGTRGSLMYVSQGTLGLSVSFFNLFVPYLSAFQISIPLTFDFLKPKTTHSVAQTAELRAATRPLRTNLSPIEIFPTIGTVPTIRTDSSTPYAPMSQQV